MSLPKYQQKIAKRAIRDLYGISYPTLRRWLRRAGLQDFIARRKFLVHEIVLIFKHLGRPRLARTASQRLLDLYLQSRGRDSDEELFAQKYRRDLPQIKQDALPDSEEELDVPPVLHIQHLPQGHAMIMRDALCRLNAIAIRLLGRKAIAREQRLLAKQSEQSCAQSPPSTTPSTTLRFTLYFPTELAWDFCQKKSSNKNVFIG